MATDNDSGVEADVRKLVAEFMKQENCPRDVAINIITRVTAALGLDDPGELLARLREIEAEKAAAPGQLAGLGIRQARIVRGLYETFVVSGTPAGHAACSAILATTAKLFPAAPKRGH